MVKRVESGEGELSTGRRKMRRRRRERRKRRGGEDGEGEKRSRFYFGKQRRFIEKRHVLRIS